MSSTPVLKATEAFVYFCLDYAILYGASVASCAVLVPGSLPLGGDHGRPRGHKGRAEIKKHVGDAFKMRVFDAAFKIPDTSDGTKMPVQQKGDGIDRIFQACLRYGVVMMFIYGVHILMMTWKKVCGLHKA